MADKITNDITLLFKTKLDEKSKQEIGKNLKGLLENAAIGFDEAETKRNVEPIIQMIKRLFDKAEIAFDADKLLSMPSRQALEEMAKMEVNQLQLAFDKALAKSGGVKIDFGDIGLSELAAPLKQIEDELSGISKRVADTTKKSVYEIEKSLKSLSKNKEFKKIASPESIENTLLESSNDKKLHPSRAVSQLEKARDLYDKSVKEDNPWVVQYKYLLDFVSKYEKLTHQAKQKIESERPEFTQLYDMLSPKAGAVKISLEHYVDMAKGNELSEYKNQPWGRESTLKEIRDTLKNGISVKEGSGGGDNGHKNDATPPWEDNNKDTNSNKLNTKVSLDVSKSDVEKAASDAATQEQQILNQKIEETQNKIKENKKKIAEIKKDISSNKSFKMYKGIGAEDAIDFDDRDDVYSTYQADYYSSDIKAAASYAADEESHVVVAEIAPKDALMFDAKNYSKSGDYSEVLSSPAFIDDLKTKLKNRYAQSGMSEQKLQKKYAEIDKLEFIVGDLLDAEGNQMLVNEAAYDAGFDSVIFDNVLDFATNMVEGKAEGEGLSAKRQTGKTIAVLKDEILKIIGFHKVEETKNGQSVSEELLKEIPDYYHMPYQENEDGDLEPQSVADFSDNLKKNAELEAEIDAINKQNKKLQKELQELKGKVSTEVDSKVDNISNENTIEDDKVDEITAKKAETEAINQQNEALKENIDLKAKANAQDSTKSSVEGWRLMAMLKQQYASTGNLANSKNVSNFSNDDIRYLLESFGRANGLKGKGILSKEGVTSQDIIQGLPSSLHSENLANAFKFLQADVFKLGDVFVDYYNDVISYQEAFGRIQTIVNERLEKLTQTTSIDDNVPMADALQTISTDEKAETEAINQQNEALKENIELKAKANAQDSSNHILSSLTKLEKITNKSLSEVINDYDNLDNSIKQNVDSILQSIGLMGSDGQFLFDRKQGGNAKAFVTDNFVILQKHITTNNEEISIFIEKIQQAKQEGIQLAEVLGQTFSLHAKENIGFRKGYEIQERGEGGEVHASPKLIELNQALAENQKILNLSDEHLQKFILDYIKLDQIGLQIDPSKPSNFLLDAEKGITFIDIGLKDVNAKAKSTADIFTEIATILSNMVGYMKFGENGDWSKSSGQIVNRIRDIFAQLNLSSSEEMNKIIEERIVRNNDMKSVLLPENTSIPADSSEAKASIDIEELRGLLNSITYNVKVIQDVEPADGNKVSINADELRSVLDGITYNVKLAQGESDNDSNKIAIDEGILENVLNRITYDVKIAHDDADKTANKIAIDESALESTLNRVFGNILAPKDGGSNIKTPTNTKNRVSDNFDERKETQRLRLEKLRAELKATGKSVAEITKLTRGLAISLGKVKNDKGLARWREKFTQKGLEVGISKIEDKSYNDLIKDYEKLGRLRAKFEGSRTLEDRESLRILAEQVDAKRKSMGLTSQEIQLLRQKSHEAYEESKRLVDAAKQQKVINQSQKDAEKAKKDSDKAKVAQLNKIAKLEKEIGRLRADADAETNEGVRKALEEEIQLRQQLIGLIKQSPAEDSDDSNEYIAYHGTIKGGFKNYDMSKTQAQDALFFTDDRDVAKTYSDGVEKDIDLDSSEIQKGIYTNKLTINNPYIVDAQGKNWDEIGDIKGDTNSAYNIGAKKFGDGSVAYQGKIWDIGGVQHSVYGDEANVHKIIAALYDPDTADVIIARLKKQQEIQSEKFEQGLIIDANDTFRYNREHNQYPNNLSNLVAEMAFAKGHDGVIFKNMVDSGGGNGSHAPSTVYAIRDASQAQIVDPATIQDGKNDALEEEISLRDRILEKQKQGLELDAQEEAYYRQMVANHTKQAKAEAKQDAKDIKNTFKEQEKEDKKRAADAKKLAQREAMLGKTGSAVGRAESTWVNAVGLEGGLPASFTTEIDEYYQKLDALRKKHQELKNSDMISEEQKNELIAQTMEINKMTSEIGELVAEYQRLSGDNVTVIGTNALGSDSNLNAYEQQLKQTVMTATNGKAQIKNFDAATRTLTYTVKTGKNEFTEYTAAVRRADGALVSVQGTTKRTETFLEATKRKMKEISSYMSGMALLSRAGQELRRGIQYVREIDIALTELKKVTDETEESYDRFLETAAKTADRVGSTIQKVVSSTADWARLGSVLAKLVLAPLYSNI